MKYRVLWAIDIEASSALEAAHLAREIQTQDNIASIFRVQGYDALIDVGHDADAEGSNRSSYTQPRRA